MSKNDLVIEKDRHNKWIRIREREYECSNCSYTTSPPTINGEPIWMYCPNCGAKMKEDD